jgi:hypothetical protein
MIISVEPETNKIENNTSFDYLLFVWMLLFMFVGCQMAFIMSPYVGSESTFMLFTPSDKNFYTYLLGLIFNR